MTRAFLSSLTVSLLAACANPAAAAPPAPESAPASGIDTRHIDPDVRPQDDFFAHLNGKWLRTVEIPPDKASWGAFAQLRDDVLPQLRALIEASQAAPARKPGSDAQKIGDCYASFMDQARRDALGLRPLSGELGRIRAVRDKKALPTLIAHLQQLGVALPYAVGVGQDARASTVHAAYIGQGGLGLPDRDYYLDAKLAGVRADYLRHIERMLALAGARAPAAAAGAVLELETALAKIQWSKVENRDPIKRYNKSEIARLDTLAPGYDWKAGLAAAGVASKTDYVIVSQPSYLAGFAALVERTSLETWQAYFEWQLLHSYAPYLSQAAVDANFAFYGRVLSGATELPPRWKRGVAAVEGALGELLGKLYVAEHFPPGHKARVEELVANLLQAYRDSIATLDWMSPETRQEAQAKLAKFKPKIAYPERWRDYGTLAMAPGDLVGNMMRAAYFGYARQVNKLGRPIDRAEWAMTPQTVNAYYSASMNEIVFPAAILQPPFFDPRADDAVNYGAIGAVIGHEISHGFDDKGSLFDGDGNLRDWWSGQDRNNFAARADMLVRQYNDYSPLPGYHVNGALTLGENIADNAGLAIAHKAYRLALGARAAPVIDGLSGEQRFYMGFAQVWRGKTRAEQQIVQIKSDPHAPAQFRANGTLKNQPGFHEAFGVREGDRMYLAPAQRVLIW